MEEIGYLESNPLIADNVQAPTSVSRRPRGELELKYVDHGGSSTSIKSTFLKGAVGVPRGELELKYVDHGGSSTSIKSTFLKKIVRDLFARETSLLRIPLGFTIPFTKLHVSQRVKLKTESNAYKTNSLVKKSVTMC
ncbi:hypothetical protein CFP56_041327 [Quercus suber]|uniref:Uncharacterized protein n=1 Tax=Quercus suber TaxID=58331 RepID=A0AAW0IVW8_QUESU